jgi:hypothetical protein
MSTLGLKTLTLGQLDGLSPAQLAVLELLALLALSGVSLSPVTASGLAFALLD